MIVRGMITSSRRQQYSRTVIIVHGKRGKEEQGGKASSPRSDAIVVERAAEVVKHFKSE